MNNILNKLAWVSTGTFALSVALLGTTQKAQAAALINGGFEEPVVPLSLPWSPFHEDDVPGWETTATDNQIEIQTPRLFHSGALGTDQYAELNAFQVSTLFQDVATTSSTNMFWRFFHRGRQGTDTMRLSIIDLDTNSTLFSQLYSTDNTAWVEYSGTTVALGSNTRWQFESVSAAGGNPAIGNFLDEVYFSSEPLPDSQSVPEPSTVLGFLAFGALGSTLQKRKQK
jgi:PEP-CTERM motif